MMLEHAGNEFRRPSVGIWAFCLGALALAGCGATLNDGTQTNLTPAGSKAGAASVVSTSGNSKATPIETSSVSTAAATAALTASATPGSNAYKIGPLDVLDVSVFKVPELSKSVQVADAGTVNLPLVGEIPAAGKTAQDVERDLTAKLGAKYLQSPQVTVFVKEYNSQRVTIEGAVKKPGVYPIRGRSTLLQFVAVAEGLTDISDSTVIIFRQADGGKKSAARFDISEIRSGATDDPLILQGDVIVANDSATKAAFSNIIKALPVTSVFAMLL